MRAFWVAALVAVAACDSGEEDQPFNDSGGSLAVPGCDYTLTTRLGAEAPKVSGSKIGPNPAPRLVHLGLMGDAQTSIVAQWRTIDETTTAGEIRYGVGANLTEAQLTEKAAGIQFGYNATGAEIYRMHQAHLCNLQPGTTYSYQVGAGNAWSPIYTFHTAPDVTASHDGEVVFGFVGDAARQPSTRRGNSSSRIRPAPP